MTPRFAPTSTERQLDLCGRLLDEHPDVYLQSHVAENRRRSGVGGRDLSVEPQLSRRLRPLRPSARARRLCALHPSRRRRTGNGWRPPAPRCRSARRRTCSSAAGSSTWRAAHAARRARGPRHGRRRRHDAFDAAHDGRVVQGLPARPASRCRRCRRSISRRSAARLRSISTTGSATSTSARKPTSSVLDPAATPHLARRMERTTTLAERLFAFMIMGDDRAVHRDARARCAAHARDGWLSRHRVAPHGTNAARASCRRARHHGRCPARDSRRRAFSFAATGSSASARRPSCRPSADTVIELAGHVLLPGLVNTHHHMFQTLTRVVPAAQDSELFGWLKALYPLWARLTPEAIRVSALTAMAELMLSGCTTSSDHLYAFPNGCRLDDTIDAAREIGLRFHATRGAMSLGESRGGLPPDALTEDEDAILRDTRRVIETFHDPAPLAMVRIGVAPCSPFSVTEALMREAARACPQPRRALAHAPGGERQRRRVQPRAVRPDAGRVRRGAGLDRFRRLACALRARSMRRGSRSSRGPAPASPIVRAPTCGSDRASRRCGGCATPACRSGLGVDGSASNDGSQMLAEARQALLLARLSGDPGALSARDALEMATRGGASVLGRDDIGHFAPGMAADFVAFAVDGLRHAGARARPGRGARVLRRGRRRNFGDRRPRRRPARGN